MGKTPERLKARCFDMSNEDNRLIHDQKGVDGENNIDEGIDLDPAENDKILMNQYKSDAQSGAHVFENHGQAGIFVDQFEHQKIQLFPAVFQKFQREISIQDT
jgi:hypothetical protein